MYWCHLACSKGGLGDPYGIIRCCQNLFSLFSPIFALTDIYCTDVVFTWLKLEKKASYWENSERSTLTAASNQGGGCYLDQQ